jgi:hypothetical protein
MNIINDINFLRVLTIIVASAFVPAFLYGVASVWMVVAGVISAQFFKARVEHILSQNIYEEDKKKNAWQLVKKYSLLVLEISIIMPLPVILFFHFSDVDSEFIRLSLDSMLLSQVSFDWVFPEGYVEKYFQIRAFIFFFGSAVVSMFCTLMATRLSLNALFHQVLYVRDTAIVEKEEDRDVSITQAYRALSKMSFFLILIVCCFYYVYFTQVLLLEKNEFLFLWHSLVSSYSLFFVLLSLSFLSFAADKKMFCK